MRAPISPRASAICKPSPREPPVTSATLPVRSNSFRTLKNRSPGSPLDGPVRWPIRALSSDTLPTRPPCRMAMDLDYTAEERAFRDEVSAWIRAHLPDDLRDKVAQYRHLSRGDLQRWHSILARQGWVAPSWPKEWGGTGWNVVERYLFDEACGYAGAPPLIPFGLLMCAPVLLEFGTPAQKERFLPPIYRGDEFWCQGYSEPGAGSDLASLRTAAIRRADRYVVNGQKIWTTAAHMADWIFCLVRTSPQTERKQDGISFLLIDMRSPGITVRPLMLMDGGHEVNEVFFDDVEVPEDNRVHDEGNGWAVAKYLLGHERMNTARIGTSQREL